MIRPGRLVYVGPDGHQRKHACPERGSELYPQEDSAGEARLRSLRYRFPSKSVAGWDPSVSRAPGP